MLSIARARKGGYIGDAAQHSDHFGARNDCDGDEPFGRQPQSGAFGGMIIGIAAVLLLTFAAFHYSTLISNKLGQTEMNVITRLMGLIWLSWRSA
ncbi:MarC family protein [Bacillus licheniformis]|nr:MarC family protein [Bacillus licheniformis]